MGQWMRGCVLLWLAALPLVASANPCGDAEDLKGQALRQELSDENRTCLEASVRGGAGLAIRSANSFVLIVDAYARRDLEEHAQLMRRHLTGVHTGDAEVAFMYADHLNRHAGASDEVLRWARVAMDGHRRWLHNRANHDKMMKHLWELRVEVSMLRAVEVAAEYQADPSPANKTRIDAYRRQARVILVEAAPCLHYGECGPYYEVEVEGYADCDNLDAMSLRADHGQLTSAEQGCLRSKYRRRGAPKSRILAMLADQADAEAGSKGEDSWNELLDWQGEVAGLEDPLLASRYADFLLDHDWARTQEALEWADGALDKEGVLTGRAGREAIARLHRLRISTLEQQLANAQAGDRSVENGQAVANAQAALKHAERSFAGFCRENGVVCRTHP